MTLAAIGLLAAACTSEPVAVAQGPDEVDRELTGISVSGEGRVMGAPDTLTVELGVSVLRDGATEAIAEAAALADQLVEALRRAGVDEADIQTSNYSIFPEFDHDLDRPRVIGYRVDNLLTVKIRDLARAGQVIDAATAVAGNDVVVHGVRFDLEDNQAMLEAARAGAWEDARGKAEQLAELAGVDLGGPLSIRETLASEPPRPLDLRTEAAAEAAPTPIEPGQLAVTVSIEVRFAIIR